MEEIVNKVVLARVAPSPLLLALWATLLVSWAMYRLVVRAELLRARAARDLGMVMRSAEDEADSPAAPRAPVWAQGVGQVLSAVAASFLGTALLGPGVATLALATVGALAPRWVWRWLRAREAARIDEDMPDLMAALAASARMSGDLAAMLMDAARDLSAKGPDRPLARLVSEAAARVRASGAESGLNWLAEQAESAALDALCLRLRLFARFGGGFAVQLEESSRRARRRLEGVNRAAAKASGATTLATLLLLLAVAGTVVIALGDPQARAFYASQLGQIAIGAIYGWMVFGYLVIQQMSDVR